MRVIKFTKQVLWWHDNSNVIKIHIRSIHVWDKSFFCSLNHPRNGGYISIILLIVSIKEMKKGTRTWLLVVDENDLWVSRQLVNQEWKLSSSYQWKRCQSGFILYPLLNGWWLDAKKKDIIYEWEKREWRAFSLQQTESFKPYRSSW